VEESPRRFTSSFVSKLGEPIFDGCIEILDRLEHGERDNAVTTERER